MQVTLLTFYAGTNTHARAHTVGFDVPLVPPQPEWNTAYPRRLPPLLYRIEQQDVPYTYQTNPAPANVDLHNGLPL